MDPYLTLESVEPLIGQLNARIDELEREVADLQRHNRELRDAVAALMELPDHGKDT